jgi:hypothetical protein
MWSLVSHADPSAKRQRYVALTHEMSPSVAAQAALWDATAATYAHSLFARSGSIGYGGHPHRSGAVSLGAKGRLRCESQVGERRNTGTSAFWGRCPWTPSESRVRFQELRILLGAGPDSDV